MARHRSDAAPGPVRTVAGIPDPSGPPTGPRTLVGTEPVAPPDRAPLARTPLPPAPESPAIGLPVVGIAPETNRLDLAAIALASARQGGTRTAGTVPPPSPALGIPAARSAFPHSAPVPVPPRGPVHGRGSGGWRRFLGTRRALVGLTVAGAVAGAGVAVAGVAGALGGSDVATRDVPAAGRADQGAGARPDDGGGNGQDQGGTSGSAGSGYSTGSGY